MEFRDVDAYGDVKDISWNDIWQGRIGGHVYIIASHDNVEINWKRKGKEENEVGRLRELKI